MAELPQEPSNTETRALEMEPERSSGSQQPAASATSVAVTNNGSRRAGSIALPLVHDHSDARTLGGRRRDGETNDAATRAHRSLPVLLARELTRYLSVLDRRVNYMQPDLLASYRFFSRPVSGAACIGGSAPGSRASSSNGTTRRSRTTTTTTTAETNSARTKPYARRQQRQQPQPRTTVRAKTVAGHRGN